MLEDLQGRVEVDPEAVASRLADVDNEELRTTLAECMQLVAIADGEIEEAEIRTLRVYFAALDVPLDEDGVRLRAASFKRPESNLSKASQAASDAAMKAASTVSSWGRAAAGWFSKKPEPEAPAPPPAEQSGVERTAMTMLERMQELADLHGAGLISDEEFQNKRGEILASL